MCEDILFAVTGTYFDGKKGLLREYQRKCLKGEIYPGIVACSGATTLGQLYNNLSSAAWKRLDLFEGDQYRREIVEVKLEKGYYEPAQTYVLKPEFADRFSSEDWDFADFLKNNKKFFEAQYSGFEILSQREL